MRKKFDFIDMYYFLQNSVMQEIKCLMNYLGEPLLILEHSVPITITSDDLCDIDISVVHLDDEGNPLFFEKIGDSVGYDIYDMTFPSLVDLYNEIYYFYTKVWNKSQQEKALYEKGK